jgi:hypothetical protein
VQHAFYARRPAVIGPPLAGRDAAALRAREGRPGDRGPRAPLPARRRDPHGRRGGRLRGAQEDGPEVEPPTEGEPCGTKTPLEICCRHLSQRPDVVIAAPVSVLREYRCCARYAPSGRPALVLDRSRPGPPLTAIKIVCLAAPPRLQPEDLVFRQAPTFEDCYPGSTKEYREVVAPSGAALRVRSGAAGRGARGAGRGLRWGPAGGGAAPDPSACLSCPPSAPAARGPGPCGRPRAPPRRGPRAPPPPPPFTAAAARPPTPPQRSRSAACT